MMRSLLSVILLSLLSVPFANAGESTEADSAKRFLQTIAAAPQVAALRLQALAAAHQRGAAGRLPDPMFGVGYAYKRMPMDRRPMYEVMLEQPFPRWGERDAERMDAAADEQAMMAMRDAMIGETAGEVARMLAELDGLRGRSEEIAGELKRVKALRETIAARVGSGTATALDQLAVDSRFDALQVRLADVERKTADVKALVRAMLGLAIDAPLPPFVAPEPTAIDPENTPAIRQAVAARASALAALAKARAMGRPMTAIGVRGELEPTDAGNETKIGATLSISLPVARGAISEAIEAATIRVQAAERQLAAAQLRASIVRGIAERAVAQAMRAEQLAVTVAARADAEQAALAAANAGGTTSIISQLDVIDRLAMLRLEVIDATVSAQQARAALWPYLNVPLETTP